MARTATMKPPARPKPLSPDDQITATLSRRQIMAIDAVFNNGLRLNEQFHLIGNTSTAEGAMNVLRKALGYPPNAKRPATPFRTAGHKL